MPKHILTTQDKEEILLKSDKFTAKQLAEQYNCSRSTILKLWMDNNYHKPLSFSYCVDNNYFSEINTPNKAYIVGLIASDGNIYKREGHQGQVRLSFQNKKSEYTLLTNILSDMQATYPIIKTTITSNNKEYEYISVTIVSEQIFNDLLNIGIIPKKTWLMNIDSVINHIPTQFIQDFLRGYFDGDGSINTARSSELKPSDFNINISMPLSNAKILQQYLSHFGLSVQTKEDKRKYNHPFGGLHFFGTNKYIFLKWIYYNDCLCLNRKQQLAIKYCNLVENNTTNRAENIKSINQYNIFLEQNKMIIDTN